MNIDDQVNQIVQGIITDLKTKVEAQVTDLVKTYVNDLTSHLDYSVLFKAALEKSRPSEFSL